MPSTRTVIFVLAPVGVSIVRTRSPESSTCIEYRVCFPPPVVTVTRVPPSIASRVERALLAVRAVMGDEPAGRARSRSVVVPPLGLRKDLMSPFAYVKRNASPAGLVALSSQPSPSTVSAVRWPPGATIASALPVPSRSIRVRLPNASTTPTRLLGRVVLERLQRLRR